MWGILYYFGALQNPDTCIQKVYEEDNQRISGTQSYDPAGIG